MNPELRSYLRVSAPLMPPEVAWPLLEKCADIEDLAKVPDDVLDTINKYLPKGVQISAQVQKFNKNHHPAGTENSKGGEFAPKEGIGTSEVKRTPAVVVDLKTLPVEKRRAIRSQMKAAEKANAKEIERLMQSEGVDITVPLLEAGKRATAFEYGGVALDKVPVKDYLGETFHRVALDEKGDFAGGIVLARTTHPVTKEVSGVVEYLGSVRRGAGTTLLDEAEFMLAGMGVTRISLDSVIESVRFYESRGYKRAKAGSTTMVKMLTPVNHRKVAAEDEGDFGLMAASKELHASVKWNRENQPRDPKGTPTGGQWTDTGAQESTGPGTMDDFTKLPIGDRNAAFQKLTREHRDALADPRNTIPARMDELLGPDRPFTNLQDYVASYADVLPAENQKLIIAFMDNVHTDARAAGMGAEDALHMQHALTRMVIAQDYEAASRTLGDHGIHHLNGDVTMAKEILGVLPSNVNTPGNRLLMSVVAATHDMGYMTPPSRNFLDLDHPRWGQQYFNAHMGPILEKYMGKDWVTLASTMIGAHDSPSLEWESHPERSAFSLSDNLALFHKEKMPPMLRHVPENINVLVKLADGKVDVASAKELMRANIEKAAYLSPKLKAAFGHAVGEVSGVLPKFTLGMVGAHYKGVTWNKADNAVEVHMERGAANEGLAKVLDLGQRQFKKFAETYHSSADELVSSGQTKFYDPIKKKLILIAKLKTRKGDFFMALKRNLFG